MTISVVCDDKSMKRDIFTQPTTISDDTFEGCLSLLIITNGMSSTKSNSRQWFTVISTPTYNNEWNEFDKKQ